MLRAHRQAWAWQDEWVGLTMADIRELELETQIILKKRLGRSISFAEDLNDQEEAHVHTSLLEESMKERNQQSMEKIRSPQRRHTASTRR